MAVRTAPIAIAYRDACNLLFPGRDRGADGFIGDAAHRAQGLGSQHNPRRVVGSSAVEELDYSNGIVLAVDVDNDYEVGNGVRSAIIARAVAEAARKCPYVSFVNWNWMVANGNGGAWRTGGADGPDHNHVSFRNDAINATYDWVSAIRAELDGDALDGAPLGEDEFMPALSYDEQRRLLEFANENRGPTGATLREEVVGRLDGMDMGDTRNRIGNLQYAVGLLLARGAADDKALAAALAPIVADAVKDAIDDGEVGPSADEIADAVAARFAAGLAS